MQSAALKALMCREITSEIFEYLNPGRPDTRDYPKDSVARYTAQCTLARLARVCHAFSDLALNILWRVTDDILWLLSILPSFDNSESRLRRWPTEQEWSRLMEYACRVRELHTDSREEVISQAVWMFLAQWLEGRPLCPRLYRLDSLDIELDQHGRLLLLSPSLRHLTIRLHRIMSGEVHIIDTSMGFIRQRRVPHLESLRLEWAGSQVPRGYTGPLVPLTEMSHLRVIEIKHVIEVDRGTLNTLMTFPLLQKLSLSILFIDGPASRTPPQAGFKSLQDLRIAATPSALYSFLELTSLASLECLTLEVIERQSLSDPLIVDTLKAAISKLPKSAHRFELVMRSQTVLPSLWDLLQPLHERDSLTHLYIKLERILCKLPLTHQEVCSMAAFWPNLVQFEFIVTGQYPGDEIITIEDPPKPQCLVAFAQNHPRLLRLTLPLIDLDGDDAMALSTIPLMNHGLEALQVYVDNNVVKRRYREFATLIDRLFPNLHLEDASDLPGRTMLYRAWGDVEQMLIALRQGRMGLHRLSSSSQK